MFINKGLNMVKMAVLSKLTYRFNSQAIKISTVLFFSTKSTKLNLTCAQKCKGPRRAILSWKRTKQELCLLNLKLVIKLQWSKWCDTPIRVGNDQWNWIGWPEINPYIYGHLNFDKDSKTIWWGKNTSKPWRCCGFGSRPLQ